MPDTLDLTAIQSNTGNYISELSELIGQEGGSESYQNFLSSLYAIRAMTDYFYTPDAAGNFRILGADQKAALQEEYERALQEAARIIERENEDDVNPAFVTIAKELYPLLQMDLQALSAPGAEARSLPETIAHARQEVVDFGDQKMRIVSGASSQRREIMVQNGLTTQKGYFTPTTTTSPGAEYREMLREMQGKYPAYKPVFDVMKKMTPGKLNNSGVPWGVDMYRLAEGDSPEEWREAMLYNWDMQFFSALHVPNAVLKELKARPDFLQFSDELFNRTQKIVGDYDKYIKGDSFIKLKPGSNIDKRNIAVSRVAGLLGKKDMVAEARPMSILVNGQLVTGTFMEEAQGEDLSHLKDGDPILQYKQDAFEGPQILESIASMQALDFITGNVDRNPGNFLLRFDPKEPPENAKLVGLSLIDNDMSFSHANDKQQLGKGFVLPREMGVIGEDVYEAMRRMTKEELKTALQDCELSDQEIEQAWERKEMLLKKIEADQKFFEDKEKGFTENGRIRLVAPDEWQYYSVKKLGQTHPLSQFDVIGGGPDFVRFNYQSRKKVDSDNARVSQIKQALGISGGVSEKPPVPTGQLISGGEVPEEEAPEREDTVKLAIPPISRIPALGSVMSKRYLLSFDENGKTTEGFFTLKQDCGVRGRINALFRDYMEKYPLYEAELLAMRDYYMTGDRGTFKLPNLEELPADAMGISKGRMQQLLADPVFDKMYQKLATSARKSMSDHEMLEQFGMKLPEGSRLELRNVAMSDTADILGVSDQVLARSRPVKVLAGDCVVEGVLMNRIDGVDIKGLPKTHPMTHIRADQADEVYNTEEGLKSIADLQVLDYLCMNLDRHQENMLYRFEGLGTDHPKFLGVSGIDNDLAFGTAIPPEGKRYGKLPPLSAIEVISEEMAQKLRDPKTDEALERKLRENALSEEEVTAAKKRLEIIRKRIDEGKLRVVKKGEWTKGENALSSLSKAENSLFHRIKTCVIDEMAEKAEKWAALPEEEKKPYVAKELQFAKSIKVEDFGSGVLKKTAYAALEKEAKEDFLRKINENAASEPEQKVETEQALAARIRTASEQAEKALGDADPLLHSRSRTYKKLRNAASELTSLTKKMQKKLRNPEDTLSTKDRNKLVKAMNKLQDCVSKYDLKKEKEIAEGKNPSEVGVRRIAASKDASLKVGELLSEYAAVVSASYAKKTPHEFLQNRLEKSQASLSGLTGEKLRNGVAKVLYYKGLSKLNIDAKNKNYFKNAMLPSTAKKEAEQLKNTPAFRALSKMKDSELRALAAGKHADKLLNRYVREMAKEKQIEKLENRKNQIVQNKAPEGVMI